MKDSPFMTAAQKERVLRHWEAFLKSGLKTDMFTRALYEHLIQHCSFIAHYDRGGFYNTYFTTGDGKALFLSQFDQRKAGPEGIPRSVECGGMWWCKGDYEDINRQMVSIASTHIPMLRLEAESQQRDRDLAQARQLLEKHGIHISERAWNDLS